MDTFEQVINVGAGKLSAFGPNLHYECTACKESWILNVPDNAWRAYFFPEDKAIEY